MEMDANTSNAKLKTIVDELIKIELKQNYRPGPRVQIDPRKLWICQADEDDLEQTRKKKRKIPKSPNPNIGLTRVLNYIHDQHTSIGCIRSDHGIGRSTVAHYLANSWATQDDIPMLRSFGVVFLISARGIANDLKNISMVFEVFEKSLTDPHKIGVEDQEPTADKDIPLTSSEAKYNGEQEECNTTIEKCFDTQNSSSLKKGMYSLISSLLPISTDIYGQEIVSDCVLENDILLIIDDAEDLHLDGFQSLQKIFQQTSRGNVMTILMADQEGYKKITQTLTAKSITKLDLCGIARSDIVAEANSYLASKDSVKGNSEKKNGAGEVPIPNARSNALTSKVKTFLGSLVGANSLHESNHETDVELGQCKSLVNFLCKHMSRLEKVLRFPEILIRTCDMFLDNSELFDGITTATDLIWALVNWEGIKALSFSVTSIDSTKSSQVTKSFCQQTDSAKTGFHHLAENNTSISIPEDHLDELKYSDYSNDLHEKIYNCLLHLGKQSLVSFVNNKRTIGDCWQEIKTKTVDFLGDHVGEKFLNQVYKSRLFFVPSKIPENIDTLLAAYYETHCIAFDKSEFQISDCKAVIAYYSISFNKQKSELCKIPFINHSKENVSNILCENVENGSSQLPIDENESAEEFTHSYGCEYSKIVELVQEAKKYTNPATNDLGFCTSSTSQNSVSNLRNGEDITEIASQNEQLSENDERKYMVDQNHAFHFIDKEETNGMYDNDDKMKNACDDEIPENIKITDKNIEIEIINNDAEITKDQQHYCIDKIISGEGVLNDTEMEQQLKLPIPDFDAPVGKQEFPNSSKTNFTDIEQSHVGLNVQIILENFLNQLKDRNSLPPLPERTTKNTVFTEFLAAWFLVHQIQRGKSLVSLISGSHCCPRQLCLFAAGLINRIRKVVGYSTDINRQRLVSALLNYRLDSSYNLAFNMDIVMELKAYPDLLSYTVEASEYPDEWHLSLYETQLIPLQALLLNVSPSRIFLYVEDIRPFAEEVGVLEFLPRVEILVWIDSNRQFTYGNTETMDAVVQSFMVRVVLARVELLSGCLTHHTLPALPSHAAFENLRYLKLRIGDIDSLSALLCTVPELKLLLWLEVKMDFDWISEDEANIDSLSCCSVPLFDIYFRGCTDEHVVRMSTILSHIHQSYSGIHLESTSLTPEGVYVLLKQLKRKGIRLFSHPTARQKFRKWYYPQFADVPNPSDDLARERLGCDDRVFYSNHFVVSSTYATAIDAWNLTSFLEEEEGIVHFVYTTENLKFVKRITGQVEVERVNQ